MVGRHPIGMPYLSCVVQSIFTHTLTNLFLNVYSTGGNKLAFDDEWMNVVQRAEQGTGVNLDEHIEETGRREVVTEVGGWPIRLGCDLPQTFTVKNWLAPALACCT